MGTKNCEFLWLKDLKYQKVIFRVREGDTSDDETICAIGGKWIDKSTDDYFKSKRVILFSLPGAFTPTCSTFQLPTFEEMYDQFKEAGVDEVYCTSVNDTFVMNAWFESLGIKNVKPLPDGNGDLARQLGLLVKKENLGFGLRSWRYAMLVCEGNVELLNIEPNLQDNCKTDPYEKVNQRCF